MVGRKLDILPNSAMFASGAFEKAFVSSVSFSYIIGKTFAASAGPIPGFSSVGVFVGDGCCVVQPAV